MKLLGVVAEYNPFHNGHAYLLKEARARSGADCVVVAMSGDFTQRGEPAILDKWTRADMALHNGADIVVEIPTVYVISDAGQYGRAGVELLKAIGCDSIAFGSECGDIDALKRVANNLTIHEQELDELIAGGRNKGLSYPAAREEAYSMLFSTSDSLEDDLAVLSSPNDILALEYIKAAGDIEIYAVRRKGAGYQSEISGESRFQSATGIRSAIARGDSVDSYIPSFCMTAIASIDERTINRRKEAFFQLIKYALLKDAPQLIEDCPSGGEGLANRLKSAVLSADNAEELIEFAKSKRYTYTRISRLLAQIVLGIRRSDAASHPGYARLLGFNVTGRKALADLKKREGNTVPVITNINKETEEFDSSLKRMIELDGLAVDVYNLIDGKSLYSNSDRVQRPIIIQK